MFVFSEFETRIGLIQLVFPENSHAPELFNIIQTNAAEFTKWLPWVPKTDSVETELKFI